MMGSVVSSSDVPNRGYVLYIVGTLMVIIAGLFVVLRIAGRCLKGGLKTDDWAIVGALLVAVVFTIVHNMGIGYGLGKHGVDISAQNRIQAFKLLLTAQVLFKLVIGLAKLSLLFLYLRIFIIGKYFRWACVSLIVFTSLATIAYIFPTLFQCQPLAAFWDRSLPHRCMNDTAIWLSYAIINIITDVLIFTLPIFQIVRLSLELRDKIALIFVFILGGFVCIISIVRTTTFPQSAEPVDVTYTFIYNATWATIELNTAIICACLPIIRQPLSILIPRVFSKTQQPAAKPLGFLNYSSSPYQERKTTNPSLSIVGRLPWTMHNGENVVTTFIEPGRDLELNRTESEERMIDLDLLQASNGGILKQTELYVSESRV